MKMKSCPKCGMQWKDGDICPFCGLQYTEPQPAYANSTSVIQPKEDSTGIPLWIFVGICAVMLVMIFFLAALVNSQGNQIDKLEAALSQNQNISDISDASHHTAPSQSEMGSADGFYAKGTYAVGKDIPAGRYVASSDDLTPTNDLYVIVYPDETMNEDTAVVRGWFQTCRLLELQEGQYVEVSFGNLYDLSKAEIDHNPFKESGMYAVGEDLSPGTYTLIAYDDQHGGSCYIYSGIEGTEEQTLSFIGFAPGETREITLREGEYIDMKFCHLKQ